MIFSLFAYAGAMFPCSIGIPYKADEVAAAEQVVLGPQSVDCFCSPIYGNGVGSSASGICRITLWVTALTTSTMNVYPLRGFGGISERTTERNVDG